VAAWLCAVAALSWTSFAVAAESDPLRVELEGRVASANGSSHPPALKELVLTADRRVTVDATGIPTCTGGGRDSRLGIEGMETLCGPAIIGAGRIAVDVAFPESTPIRRSSKLLLINRGVSAGTTTWYLYSYFTAPITAEVVFSVEIRKHRDGTRAVVRVPKIAGGYGSVVSFRLRIARSVEGAGGETYHPIAGRCTSGDLPLDVDARFAASKAASLEFGAACVPQL